MKICNINTKKNLKYFVLMKGWIGQIVVDLTGARGYSCRPVMMMGLMDN